MRIFLLRSAACVPATINNLRSHVADAKNQPGKIGPIEIRTAQTGIPELRTLQLYTMRIEPLERRRFSLKHRHIDFTHGQYETTKHPPTHSARI